MRIARVSSWAVLLAAAIVAAPASANMILSTEHGARLGDPWYGSGDLVDYDLTTGASRLVFDEDLFGRARNIDAVHAFDAGQFVISTSESATLGGLSFTPGDLVQYDMLTGKTLLFFDHQLLGPDARINIDAVYVRPNGNIILSTDRNARLAGLSFRDGDLVEYDPLMGTASLLFNEDLFTRDEDIDALDILPNGHLLLSTVTQATLGGLDFGKDDLVEYDTASNRASIFLDGEFLGHNISVDAISIFNGIPEPAVLSLLAVGGVILALRRRGRRPA
jgi:hypothetical protein